MAKKSQIKNSKTEADNAGTQTFSLAAPTAKSVELAGDFTHWQQAPMRMQKGADGIWRVNVKLSPGPHTYRFLVDGQWHDDPECPLHVPNPYGGQDAIRQVV